jgi:hypothetical protein
MTEIRDVYSRINRQVGDPSGPFMASSLGTRNRRCALIYRKRVEPIEKGEAHANDHSSNARARLHRRGGFGYPENGVCAGILPQRAGHLVRRRGAMVSSPLLSSLCVWVLRSTLLAVSAPLSRPLLGLSRFATNRARTLRGSHALYGGLNIHVPARSDSNYSAKKSGRLDAAGALAGLAAVEEFVGLEAMLGPAIRQSGGECRRGEPGRSGAVDNSRPSAPPATVLAQ